MVKIRASVKKAGKAKPIKAGQSSPKNIGGIANRKVVKISKKLRNG